MNFLGSLSIVNCFWYSYYIPDVSRVPIFYFFLSPQRNWLHTCLSYLLSKFTSLVSYHLLNPFTHSTLGNSSIEESTLQTRDAAARSPAAAHLPCSPQPHTPEPRLLAGLPVPADSWLELLTASRSRSIIVSSSSKWRSLISSFFIWVSTSRATKDLIFLSSTAAKC